MVTGIIGKKLGMAQVFAESGEAEAVTAIEAGPCVVIQIKTEAREGYSAAQLGFGQAKKPAVARKAKGKDKGRGSGRKQPASHGASLGQKMEISGPTLSGGRFDISQYRGKVVLVDF